jgi:hypothetical protein
MLGFFRNSHASSMKNALKTWLIFGSQIAVFALGGHFKTGQWGTGQNRPTEWPGT